MALLVPVFFTSCREDADRNWETAEPTFTLYETSLGTNVLYPTMATNPFILNWQDIKSDKYTVVVSATEDFAVKKELGTSATNSYKTTVDALNTAILQLTNPYQEQTVYVRIEAGTQISNTIKFTVTPYPASKPVIKNPLSGANIVLNGTEPTANAVTVKWDDYTYATTTTVNYKVEIAKKGTTAFNLLGTTTTVKELVLTNFALNEAVLKLGGQVGVASEYDIRVTAETVSTGGTITKTSELVSIAVTPYQPAYGPFYIVGGFVAPYNWNASNAVKLFENQNIAEMYAYLDNGATFRFLGQKDWNPLNYSLNNAGIKENYKYFKTWTTNLAAAGDENMTFSGDTGIHKITIDQNSRDIKIVPIANNAMPSELFLVGSLNGWNSSTAIPMEATGFGEFKYTIAIPDGAAFKFLGQQSWGDLEWGNIHGEGNSGYIGPKGDNNNIVFNGGGNLYEITVNLAFGFYTVLPK